MVEIRSRHGLFNQSVLCAPGIDMCEGVIDGCHPALKWRGGAVFYEGHESWTNKIGKFMGHSTLLVMR